MTQAHIDRHSIGMTSAITVRRHSGMGITADRHSAEVGHGALSGRGSPKAALWHRRHSCSLWLKPQPRICP